MPAFVDGPTAASSASSRVAALVARLPVGERAAEARARADARARPLHYPVGSGQGEEVALGAGFRPLIRQLLDKRSLQTARERFERAGFVTGVAERTYGATHDGWDETPTPLEEDAPSARRALFVGRERSRVQAAIACDLAKTDDADRELGRLLGYPRCCVEAFVATSKQRRNAELYAAALGQTSGPLAGRLNMLDLAVFHFVSWTPCAFDCRLSLGYADAVAQRLLRRHAGFVAAIDAALSAPRLVLLDEVQIALRAEPSTGGWRVLAAWPVARDRHPSVPLAPDVEDAVVRALVAVRAARTLRVGREGLVLDDRLLPGTEGALLLPFGAPSARNGC